MQKVSFDWCMLGLRTDEGRGKRAFGRSRNVNATRSPQMRGYMQTVNSTRGISCLASRSHMFVQLLLSETILQGSASDRLTRNRTLLLRNNRVYTHTAIYVCLTIYYICISALLCGTSMRAWLHSPIPACFSTFRA